MCSIFHKTSIQNHIFTVTYCFSNLFLDKRICHSVVLLPSDLVAPLMECPDFAGLQILQPHCVRVITRVFCTLALALALVICIGETTQGADRSEQRSYCSQKWNLACKEKIHYFN